MMKKWLALTLCLLTVFSLCACGTKPGTVPAETTQPVPTQSQEEAKVEKILIIGNSHSGDTIRQLQQEIDAHYGKDDMLGYLYYSACTISQHLQFATNDEPVYAFRLNYTGKAQGVWDDTQNVTLKMALRNQAWDVIVFQADDPDRRKDQLNLTDRRALEDYVRKQLTPPYKFMWNTTWADAADGPVYAPDWPRQPPAGYTDRLVSWYGWDSKVQFTDIFTKDSTNILSDDTYEKAICPGAAVAYSLFVQERPQTEIYRDYTHLTDYARLMTAYAFYTQYTGEKVNEIKVDVIPVRLRQAQFQKEGDLVITDEMKARLLEAVNYAFDHPYEVPAK